MCGIAGVVGRDDPPLARRMLDLLAHRGPDGHDTWSAAGVTLGHRRLAIVDVATGRQPMQDQSGRFTVTYNGEVYNHLALRAELEALGHSFRTHSDTEVILEGWRRWGPQVLQRLEGMFALCVWDAVARTATFARDLWGIKPLYLARVDGDWLFASEQKAFLAHPGFRFVADLAALREQAVWEFSLGTTTLFEGIQQVAPGSYAVLRDGELTHHALPRPTPVAPASPEEAATLIHAALRDSVREQLMGEVPVGVVLSGGLDSAAVAVLHQAASDRPIPTFTLAESEEVEDLRVARDLAARLGTDHHEATWTYEEAMGLLPTHAWHHEASNYTEAFFLPLFGQMRRTVTVGLCGQGSDELWGGYARYKQPGKTLAERQARAARMRMRLPAAAAAAHASPEALAKADQGGQLANFQLRLVDRSSMAHGLEVRVPFLSRRLQALSDGTPWAWKMEGGIEKWVLRKAAEAAGVPRDVAWRPKVPAGRATSPTIMQRFEAECARRVDARRMTAHPLADAFQRPAEYVMHRAWEELFLHGADRRRLRLEDLA